MERSRKVGIAAVLTLGALFASACGDDSGSSSATTAGSTATTAGSTATTAASTATTAATATTAGSTATTAASADPLGTPKAADKSMSTLKVGYIWSGVSPAVDNSADLASAQATVKWINEYRGGINGHPLELVPCATNSDNSVAATCGSTLLESKVPIVLFNVVGEVEPWATPVMAAKIPILAYSSADPSLLKDPTAAVFTMTNPIAGLGTFPAIVAKTKGITKSAISVIDVPAATQPVQNIAPAVFKGVGAGEVDIVPISPTAPDHGSAIQAELSKNSPGLVHMVGNPAYCTLTVKALADAGYKGVITMISNCLDTAAKKALEGQLEGKIVSYSAGEDPKNKDYIQVKAIAAKYGSGKYVPTGTPVGSYVVLEAFYRLTEGMTGDFTSDNFITTIRNHAPIDSPTIDGGQIKCDGKALAGIPIACTSSFAYSVLDKDGNPTTFTGVK